MDQLRCASSPIPARFDQSEAESVHAQHPPPLLSHCSGLFVNANFVACSVVVFGRE